jgi:6-phosphogluconolactonase (cycloisomerase 2 family)
MPTAIIKDFITDNGLEVEGSITLGDQIVTELVDSSTISAIVTSPSIASNIVATGGATTKTYDSADLLPASDNATGEMAYVNANNRLYLWNGVGWYGIALINVSPTFDSGGSPNSSYTLDSNGGATTTITLNATDPEGATIQYSYLSDSASNFVTISQSNNVFTLTTLSDSALDSNGYTFGTNTPFNITFRATDGVNIAPAVSSFSLTIIVNYDWTTSSQQGSRFETEGSSVNAYFGDDVGISRNGNTIIVGAKYERLRANGTDGGTGIKGTANIFTRSGTTWSHEQRLVSPNYSSTTDQFGYAVAISGDGTLAAIGAPFRTTTISSQDKLSGGIEVWKKRNGTWEFGCQINPSVDPYGTGENDHQFGLSVDVDAVGDRIIVGVPKKNWNQSPARDDCGAVFVYKNNGDKSYDLPNGALEGSYTVSSQDGDPMGIAFNNDGTKFYMGGQSTDAIYQYSLSTAYDVTTATYDNVSLDISTEVPYVTAINWNNDGTKLWASTPNSYGGASSSLFEYAFTTPYDLSTGSYNNYDINFTSDVSLTPATEPRPWGLTFKPDGTKMFMTGWNGRVHAFNLSTAWDISSFSYIGETSSSFTSQDSNMQGLEFNPDGTKCFLVGRGTDKIFQYSLSVAWNVSTMAYDDINLDVSVEGTPSQMAFNPTGTKLYVTGYTSNKIHQFSVQGLDVSEEAIIYANDASADDMLLGWDVVITPDGNRIIAGAEQRDAGSQLRAGAVYVFDRSGTTWSQFANYIQASDAYSDDDFGASVDVTSDGNTIVVGAPREDTGATDAGAAYIYEYGGTAYYDIPSMVYNNKYFTVSTQENQPTGFAFNGDGTKMFVVGRQYHRVFAYSLSTAYDVSTATYDGYNYSKFIGTVNASTEGMQFSPDGTKCYFIGDGSSTQDRLWQYNLSVPYNILTMAYSNNYIQVSSQNSNPSGFTFKPDGTKFFVVGYSGNDHVYVYDLTTAWDLSTASYNNVSFQVSGQNTDMKDIKFNADGTKMFATGSNSNGRMYQYNLSTAWDISSASYNSVYYHFGSNGEYLPHQVDFNPDGTKLWMIGQTNDRIYEFETNSEIWTETKLMASNAAASSDYGRSVAIDEQGQIIMVGSNKYASSIGEVYVYKKTGASWSSSTEEKKLISLTSDTSTGTPQFGDAVALSRGGGTAVVGAPSVLASGAGSAGGIYIFTGTRT